MRNRRQEDIVEDRHLACRFTGYGWPATLELLSPPIGKPVDSRQHFKMTICPFCNCVHESSGICLSRHRQGPPPFLHGRPVFHDDLRMTKRERTEA